MRKVCASFAGADIVLDAGATWGAEAQDWAMGDPSGSFCTVCQEVADAPAVGDAPVDAAAA